MQVSTPTTPSFVFGYWRPWKEDSNLIDSYLDYRKDVSLVKYGADTIGKYISQASKEQVEAIDRLGYGIDAINSELSTANKHLEFLNRNVDIIREQNKLNNLLLQNIAEVVVLPDNEKQRQHSIQLGIKFLSHAQKNPELFNDALEEFLNAVSLMKQDYFALYNIGLIYLYATDHLNPKRALEYLMRAAKYASVDSIPNNPYISSLIRALYHDVNDMENVVKSTPLDLCDHIAPNYDSKIKDTTPSQDIAFIQQLSTDQNECYAKINSAQTESQLQLLHVLISKMRSGFEDMMRTRPLATGGIENMLSQEFKFKTKEIFLMKELKKAGIDLDTLESRYDERKKELLERDRLNRWPATVYEKAAFAAYVTGDFALAEKLQSEATKLNRSGENLFLLAKYLSRNATSDTTVEVLNEAISNNPDLYTAVFAEIDLISNPKVITLLSSLNLSLNMMVQKEVIKKQSSPNHELEGDVGYLKDLLNKPYPEKVKEFGSYIALVNTVPYDKRAGDILPPLAHG